MSIFRPDDFRRPRGAAQPPDRPQRGLGRDRRRPAAARAGADRPAARLAGAVMSEHHVDPSETVDVRTGTGWALAGVAVVLVLGGLARLLEQTVPGRHQGHRVRRDRRGHRVPGVRDRAGPARQRRAHPARPAGPAGRRLPHRVLHQDRAGAARRVDQHRGDRQRRRAGHPAGAGPDQRGVRVHLVAGRPARARRQAARAAGLRGVDLRGERGHRRGRRGAGQEGAAGLHGQHGHHLRAAVDLPAAGWRPGCSGWTRPWPGPGSAATSTPPRR